MPAELFVDSDDGDDFENGEDSGSESDQGMEIAEEGDNDNDVGEEEDSGKKGKKRKNLSKKESKKSKKLKKLGPKEAKGKREEKLTTEEIKELSAKEYAHYSNLYNVQIEEVLRESEISGKRKEEVLVWVEEFKKFAKSISKSKKFLVKDYAKILNPIQLPLSSQVLPTSENEDEQRWEWMRTQSLQWTPPVDVNVRGAWEVNTALNKVSSLDLFLEMPYDYLVKSDTLNHKYHVKRAIYLGFLAKKLAKRGDVVKFTLANGERLRPVISLTINRIQVLIHAIPPRDFFKVKKLTCEKNNLRFEHFFNKALSEDEPESSTQHYNFTILEDLMVNEVSDATKSFLKNRPNVQNAIKLIKIWLTQRELSKGYGSISGFIVTQLARHLFQSQKINEKMSAFQIVRIFFASIIQMDLDENGISFSSDPAAIQSAHIQWENVLLDSSGQLNFMANVNKFTYKRVQQEARRSLAIIDTGNVAGFTALFLTKVTFLQNFDHVVRLTNTLQIVKCVEKRTDLQSSILDHSGHLHPVVVSVVGNLIESSLGKRINMIDCKIPEVSEWNANNVQPYKTKLWFGMNINRELSQRIVEKCESSEEQAIEDFKQFWGEKSELRRFKDGTMLESVTIENLVDGIGRSRSCYQMLAYILKRHLGYKLRPEEYIDRQLEDLVENHYVKLKPTQKAKVHVKKIYLNGKLAKKKVMKETNKPQTESVSVDQITRHASNSFDEFSKMLRLLEELPLQISTVQGTSPVLRFSHVFPCPPQAYYQCKALTEVDPKKKAMLIQRDAKPKKGNVQKVRDSGNESDEEEEQVLRKLPKYVEPIGVIIHLETSGQWPDNMEAIDRLKCAFLIKIGELITQKFGLLVQPYPRHLDVLKDGFVFRVRITYFRELTLLRELRGPDGILRVRDNPESLRLEREALILPQLTSTLHSFHLQYEAFGKTCRLAKRWIASQLLLSSPSEYNRNFEEPDCRFSEECVEILVASLFLNFAPHLNFPSEAHVGFHRFLQLLANTDFRAVPIMVNFNDKLTPEETAAIELEFVKIRTTLPSLYISIPFDQKGSVWTRNLSPVILGRAQLLAKQALSVIDVQFEGFTQDHSELQKIFRPSTNQFDVIIKLKNQMNTRAYQNIEDVSSHLQYHQYFKRVNEVLPVVDFDPVQLYLQELRNTFGHMAVFLHDTFGGKYIAAVWKPEVFKATTFTGTNVKGRQLGKKGDTIVANVSGILETFEVLGSGLVEEIQTQSDKWKFE